MRSPPGDLQLYANSSRGSGSALKIMPSLEDLITILAAAGVIGVAWLAFCGVLWLIDWVKGDIDRHWF